MIRRARTPVRVTMVLVGAIVVPLPILIGLPTLSIVGVLVLASLAVSLWAIDATPEAFRRAAHAVYFVSLASVAYAVFGLGLPPVITVYFPALVLLAASHILGARAAILWSIPSVALVAAGVFFPPLTERAVAPAITFAVRAATLLTILAFGVSFRRSQDRQSAELLRYATTDALTGLANRRDLDRALEEALGRSARFERRGALVFVDLDGLKSINDRLGHEAGDELLRFAASRITANTRRVDTPARLGGDEFVILLSELEDPKGGEIVARKLLGALREPCVVGGESVVPSASVGVVLFPDAGDESRQLLRLADDAMYQAKRAGGGCGYLHDGKGLREIV